MDQIKIGKYIQTLRKEKGYTQTELAEKLNITFQAISIWENGETLPDVGILLELSEILGVTVDSILHGGTCIINDRKKASIKEIEKGFNALQDVKRYFGEKSLFYIGMVEGINSKMNMDIEDALNNHREVLVAEVLLQGIKCGKYYVDIDEAEKYFTNNKLLEYIKNEMNKISVEK